MSDLDLDELETFSLRLTNKTKTRNKNKNKKLCPKCKRTLDRKKDFYQCKRAGGLFKSGYQQPYCKDCQNKKYKQE